MSAIALACVSFGLMAGFVAAWLSMVKRVQIKRGRWLLNLLTGTAIVSGVLAFVKGPGLLAGILAGLGLLVSVMFIVLSSLARQSGQGAAVTVGDPIPDFSACDENGEVFDFASLRGQPTLLKFFRGHW